MSRPPIYATFWTDERKDVVRKLLRQSYDRELICLRLGISRRTLKTAIGRYGLDKQDRVDG